MHSNLYKFIKKSKNSDNDLISMFYHSSTGIAYLKKYQNNWRFRSKDILQRITGNWGVHSTNLSINLFGKLYKSLISEASISGKPIYVYQLPMKRKSKRFIRFHEEFKKMNITRDFNTLDKLENWTYTKLEESKRIAGIIKKRIIERNNES